MDKDVQSRKWLMTLNNPQNHGYSRQRLLELLNLLTFRYCCLCDERSESGTYHTHVYLYSTSPIKFMRLKNLFPGAHIDKARGTSQENREYISKTGKWSTDKKAGTNLPETFLELGTLPKERIPQAEKKEKLYEMIESGMSATEIIEADKEYIYKLKNIEELIQLNLSKKYALEPRKLKVIYLYGDTGTGKTYHIQQKHGAGNICRITAYRKQGNGVYFDGYRGQDVLVFEEFAGQVPMEEMLNYLDVYPLYLPARYTDKVACYTTVYLTSNLPLYRQYLDIQREKPKTWNAFLRRIHEVVVFKQEGTTRFYKQKGEKTEWIKK